VGVRLNASYFHRLALSASPKGYSVAGDVIARIARCRERVACAPRPRAELPIKVNLSGSLICLTQGDGAV